MAASCVTLKQTTRRSPRQERERRILPTETQAEDYLGKRENNSSRQSVAHLKDARVCYIRDNRASRERLSYPALGISALDVCIAPM
jgi:hypothetical protein